MANIQWLNLISLMFEDGLCKLSSSLNAGLCLIEGYELCLLSSFPLKAFSALSLFPVLSSLQVLKQSIYVTDADL